MQGIPVPPARAYYIPSTNVNTKHLYAHTFLDLVIKTNHIYGTLLGDSGNFQRKC